VLPRFSRAGYAGAFIAMLLTGCKPTPDLDAVRQLAAAAAASAQSFTRVSADFYDSCARQHSWHNLVVSAPAQTTLDADCSDAATASRQWSDLNRLLIAYYIALGAIAGKADDGKTDYGIPGLAAAIDARGNKLAVSGAKSAADIAAGLLHDLYAARRRDAIALQATAAAPAVTRLTAVLTQIAQANYRDRALVNERRQLDAFFAPLPPADRPTNLELYALDQLRLSQRSEDAAIDRKQHAASAYIVALNDLADANVDLLAAMRAGSPDAIRAAVTRYFGGYTLELTTIDAAYATPGAAQ
jgi:hypothetical protein